MRRKIFTYMVSIALCLILLPFNTQVKADTSVQYLDASGMSQTVETYETIHPGMSALGSSGSTKWYVVEGEVSINSRLNINGDVHLILLDDSSLVVNGGVEVNSNNSLTVYSQSLDKDIMGRLEATATSGAGIGGEFRESNGTITVNGGYIVAKGGINEANGGAGIGAGGRADSVKSIIINNGYVEAYGGYCGDSTQELDRNGAGAGIGAGGWSSNVSDIEINGGEIHAYAGYNGAAGIGGGGHDGTLSNITVTGGLIYAQGTYKHGYVNSGKANAIGGGAGKQSADRSSFTNAIIIDDVNKEISIHGDENGIRHLSEDLTIPAGYRFYIYGELIVDEGYTLTNEGTIDHTYGGIIRGNFVNNGSIEHVLNTAESVDEHNHIGVCACGETVSLPHQFEFKKDGSQFIETCSICNYQNITTVGELTYNSLDNSLFSTIANTGGPKMELEYKWQKYKKDVVSTTPGVEAENEDNYAATFSFQNVPEDGAVAVQVYKNGQDEPGFLYRIVLELYLGDKYIDLEMTYDELLENGESIIFDHLSAGNYTVKIVDYRDDLFAYKAESVETSYEGWVDIDGATSNVYQLSNYQNGDEYKLICSYNGQSIEKTITLPELKEISGLSAQDALYDGKEHSGYSGEVNKEELGEGSLDVVYYQLVDGQYQKIDSLPIEVGDYQIVFIYSGNSGNPIAHKELTFKISYDGELQEDGTIIKTEVLDDETKVVTHSKIDGTVLDKTTIKSDGSSVKEEYREDGTTVVTSYDTEGEILEVITKYEDGSYIIEGYHPVLIQGDGSTYNGNGELRFKSDDSLVNFLMVKVDGKELDAKYYELKNDGITITLNKEYLDSLNIGSYSLSIVSKNGEAMGTFYVTADKRELSSKVEEYKVIDKGNYSDESYNKFLEVLAEADKIVNDPLSSQDEVDMIMRQLKEAYISLEIITPPVITSGNNSFWNTTSKDGLIFRSDAEFKDFLKVLVDNKEVDSKYYTVKEGSTIVTLSNDFLKTLSVGKHTLSIVSTNGTATANFEVVKGELANTAPDTGINTTNAYLLSLSAILSLGVIAILIRKKKYLK